MLQGDGDVGRLAVAARQRVLEVRLGGVVLQVGDVLVVGVQPVAQCAVVGRRARVVPEVRPGEDDERDRAAGAAGERLVHLPEGLDRR